MTGGRCPVIIIGMKINIKVKPNSRQEAVEEAGAGSLLLKVNAPAREGKANAAVLRLLSAYLNIPKSRISIIRGSSGRDKVVEIR